MVYNRPSGALTAHPRSRDTTLKSRDIDEEFQNLGLGVRSGSAIDVIVQNAERQTPIKHRSRKWKISTPIIVESQENEQTPPRLLPEISSSKFPQQSVAYVHHKRTRKAVKARYLDPRAGWEEGPDRTYKEWRAKHSPRSRASNR